MTTSLQELIDDSIFISTEHQARLAELSQGVEWDVDFSVPSFTLQSDPPVVLTPHLLGTDSADRGSWVWSWQELGHFPSEVVAAAVQSRESAARSDVTEMINDELPTRDGLARQLTLASKTLTGVWAHYPARVGKNVTAWLLLDGAELELEPVTLEIMMQVIAEALQTGSVVDHNRALDSYAKLRGMHIEWDTDAMCVITTRDGAQRFWLEEHQISGVEPAEATVGEDILARLEQEARTRREVLAADRTDARRIAEDQAVRDTAAREAEESSRREATAAAVAAEDAETVAGGPADQSLSPDADVPVAAEAPAAVSPEYAGAAQGQELPQASEYDVDADVDATQEPLPAELSREDLEAPVPGASTEGDQDLPYDQEPRRDVAPGEVTTTTLPSSAEERDAQDHDSAAAGTQEPLEESTADHQHAADGEDFAAEQPANVAGGTEEAEDTTSEQERPVVLQPRVEEPATARSPMEEAGQPVPVATTEQTDDTDPRREQHPEETARPESVDPAAPETQEQTEADQPRKKGFFSRFFGL